MPPPAPAPKRSALLVKLNRAPSLPPPPLLLLLPLEPRAERLLPPLPLGRPAALLQTVGCRVGPAAISAPAWAQPQPGRPPRPKLSEAEASGSAGSGLRGCRASIVRRWRSVWLVRAKWPRSALPGGGLGRSRTLCCAVRAPGCRDGQSTAPRCLGCACMRCRAPLECDRICQSAGCSGCRPLRRPHFD